MNDFPKLFAYDRWANREVLRVVSALRNPPSRSVKLIAHIIGTQEVWYARMMGTSNIVPVWPDWDVAMSGVAIDAVAEKWKSLAGRDEDFMRKTFSYTNSKGERWTSSFEDTLTHVAMHGTYHRGQIAADIRASGNEPPYTDFIHATRAGLLT